MKYKFFLKLAFMIVIVSVFLYRYLGMLKQNKVDENQAWVIEEGLVFEGIITEYNGEGLKSSPTVFTIGQRIVTVPRTNIEMAFKEFSSMVKLS